MKIRLRFGHFVIIDDLPGLLETCEQLFAAGETALALKVSDAIATLLREADGSAAPRPEAPARPTPAPTPGRVAPDARRCEFMHRFGDRCRCFRGPHPHFCPSHRPKPPRPPTPPDDADVDKWKTPLPAVTLSLTDEDCWRQADGPWQGRDWRRESLLEDVAPDRCSNCGSVDVAWNGSSFWCDRCGGRVEPPPPREVSYYPEPIAPWTYPVAAIDRDDADYRQATAIFRHGALEARAHGWVSPHWNRLREGQPYRRR